MDNSKLATSKALSSKKLSLPDEMCRKLFLKVLSNLKRGSLTLNFNGESHLFGKAGESPSAEITIDKESVFSDFVLGGSLGCGESYIRGEWRSENLSQR